MAYPSEAVGPPTVVAQPEKGQSIQMAASSGPQSTYVNLPPVLNYLAQLDKVMIHQTLHAVEVFLSWERNNEYTICNTAEQQFLRAKEDTDCCTRQMCGTMRPFLMNIMDMQNQTVLQLDRPFRGQGCLCPCWLQKMNILLPGGQLIATIKELWTLITPKYEVVDAGGNLLYTIQGDCCYCKCCMDVAFKVYRPDGSEVGEITKHWNGCAEILTGTNEFSVTFPVNEPLFNKAILLAATYLVDFMYFEINKN